MTRAYVKCSTSPHYGKQIEAVEFDSRCTLVALCSRVMAVLEPLKVTITNFPSDKVMELTVPNFPEDESRGSHTIKFDSVIYIEKSDFTEVHANVPFPQRC